MCSNEAHDLIILIVEENEMPKAALITVNKKKKIKFLDLLNRMIFKCEITKRNELCYMYKKKRNVTCNKTIKYFMKM